LQRNENVPHTHPRGSRTRARTRKGERLAQNYFAGARHRATFRTGWTGPPKGVAREGDSLGDRAGIDCSTRKGQHKTSQRAISETPNIPERSASRRRSTITLISLAERPCSRALFILLSNCLGCLDVELLMGHCGHLSPTAAEFAPCGRPGQPLVAREFKMTSCPVGGFYGVQNGRRPACLPSLTPCRCRWRSSQPALPSTS